MGIAADFEAFHYYNNIEDVNKKELNTMQKDSIDLLKRNIGGLGAHFYIPFQGKRSTIKLTPLLYVTNIATRVGVDYAHYFLDSTLIVSEQLSFEKVLGTYKKDSTLLPFEKKFTIDEKYEGPSLKADSSDLLSAITTIELRKVYDRFSFSIPLRYLHYAFRTNVPILSSRSNLSLNPELQFFIQRNKLQFDFSATCFLEYQNYFGKGRVRENLNSTVFNADYYDKYYITPQVTTELQYKKLKGTYSFLWLYEQFTNRESQINAFALEQNENKTISASLGEAIKSVWFQQTIGGEFHFTERFRYMTSLEYLLVTERYQYTRYESVSDDIADGWHSFGRGLNKKGTDLLWEQGLPVQVGNYLTVTPCVIFEWRDAPIHDSLTVNSKHPQYFVPNYEGQYLWEHYKAYEPAFSIQIRGKKSFVLLRQSLRWEKLQEEERIKKEVYQRENEQVIKTVLQSQIQFRQNFRLALNSMFSIRKSDDAKERNITTSISIIKGIHFDRKSKL